MVRYLECEHSGVKEYYKHRFETANTVDLTASGWYRVLFTYFSHKKSLTLVGPLLEKVPRVPGRRFPMVEYPFLLADKCVRWTRVIIVEVMDLSDPQLSWDVKNSDVYEEIRDMDPAHPERKSFGSLSAGTSFILFEVTGKEDPVFLLGSPESPANFIEDAESLEMKMEYILKVAITRECKCPDTREATSGAVATVGGNLAVTAKAALSHDAESDSTISGPMALPILTTEIAPVTSVSNSVGRVAERKPVFTVTNAVKEAISADTKNPSMD